MNNLVKTILNHEYADSTMKKQVYIYKRSRSKRIKNKVFVKLLSTFTTEKPIAEMGDLVLIKIGAYRELMTQIKELEEQLVKMQERQNAKNEFKEVK